MLECKKLELIRGGKTLFKDLSFKVGKGRVLVIRGRNGSGKTSLLKTLLGLLNPADGQIIWNKKAINSDPFTFRRQLVFLGHNNAIKANQTVGQNIQFFSKIYPSPKPVGSVAKQIDLDKLTDIECYRLSAGWQRRVALSRFLVSSGKFWIMDEPFANLDAETKKLFKDILYKHLKNGGSAIITSHEEKFINAKEINLDKFKSS